MFFRRYRLHWIGVFMLSCLVNLLLLGPSLHMLLTYDYVLTSGSRATLFSLFAIVAVLLLCMWGLDYSRQTLAGRAGQRMSLDLQKRAFLAGINSRNREAPEHQGDVIGDIRQVRKFMGSTPFLAFLDAPWVPFYLAVEFMLHPLLGWTATGAAVATFFLALTVEFRSRRVSQEEMTHSRRESGFRASVFGESVGIEAHGMASRLYRRWCENHDRMLLYEDEVGARIAFWTTLSKASRMIAQVLILSLGAWLVLEEEIGPGMMIVGSIVMTRALSPVEQCISGWRPFIACRRAMGRIREKFAHAESAPEEDATPVKLAHGRLEVTDISAGPPAASTPVIQGVSLALRPGELLQIVGNNGSGKSTLLKTLSGAWMPLKGQVRLGEVGLHQWASSDRGQHVGYLGQPPGFFRGTVAENISRMENDLGKLRKATLTAGCESAFNGLPQHLDTPLGPNGENVSVGMRQRIGLARAIYGDPELVLLDEPETGLDQDGHQQLTKMIQEIKRQGAVVAVASHSMMLAHLADKMLALKDGRVVKYGPVQVAAKRSPPPDKENG